MTEPASAAAASGTARTDDQLRALMREAVREGVRDAITDRDALDAFCDAMLERLQANAEKKTGRLVWAGLRALVTKWLLILLLVAGAMKLGGAELAVKVWKAVSA